MSSTEPFGQPPRSSHNNNKPPLSSVKSSSKTPQLQVNIDAQIADNVEDIVQIINDNETRNFQLGIVLLVIAIGSWIIGLELVNSVLKGDEYRKPCLFAWITGSCFSLNYVPDIISYLGSKLTGSGDSPLDEADASSNYSSGAPGTSVGETDPLLSSPSSTPRSLTTSEKFSIDGEPVELTRREIVTLAFQIAIIYSCYNIFVMLALQYTSASNQTVLGSTTSIFTLFIGAFIKIDKITIKKLICIFVSLAGVFLINWSESGKGPSKGGSKFEPKNPILGNCLAVLGALMYAFYLIIMKVRCGTGKTTNERRLFGLVGIFTFFLGIPCIIFVDLIGFEPFEFPPPSNSILFSVLINGTFSIISDYATILAMLVTSPLVTSLSLTSAIPITIFIDFLIARITGEPEKDNNGKFVYFLGIASILISVVLINVNLTSENELIEEFIEEALEEAIREDEALSPILSPLLSPKSPFVSNSPFLSGEASNAANTSNSVGVNFQTILTSFSPKTKPSPPPQQAITGFQLPQSQMEGFNSIHAATDPHVSDGKILIFGGKNHRYHVKNLYHEEHTDNSNQ